MKTIKFLKQSALIANFPEQKELPQNKYLRKYSFSILHLTLPLYVAVRWRRQFAKTCGRDTTTTTATAAAQPPRHHRHHQKATGCPLLLLFLLLPPSFGAKKCIFLFLLPPCKDRNSRICISRQRTN